MLSDTVDRFVDIDRLGKEKMILKLKIKLLSSAAPVLHPSGAVRRAGDKLASGSS